MKLEGKDLYFSYAKSQRQILDGVNIEINSSEQIGLIAPSGFGKTTLCKVLAGYEIPQKGEVLLDGKPLPKKGYSPVQLIWQHPEQVVNPKLQMGKILSDVPDIPTYIMEALGIETPWLMRFPHELSGGELQRFCIARALGGNTKFLIADEITTMLDLITQSQLWHFLIDEVKRRDIGLLAVSHDSELLRLVTTKQIELDK